MRIFLAGATGAIGTRLVPMLIEAGHEVVGTTRTERNTTRLREAGAEPVVLDALDGDAVGTAVDAAQPDVVVHQLTAIGATDFKHLDTAFAGTNRLRTQGLDHLLAAARAAGASRFVAQSFVGWPNERSGGPVKTEDDPLSTDPAGESAETLRAIKYVDHTTTSTPGVDGLALRYGFFYGPGTSIDRDGELTGMIRKRRLPIVGGGTAIWSMIHIDDAARATLQAIENGRPGVYNIVDDDPAPVRDVLTVLADAAGAKRPMRVPRWLARSMIGRFGEAAMVELRGSSNAKAKREFGWEPEHRSWRDGFHTVLS
ncbi:nucleoside-diphosphate-sugar epimerase [Haloactinopolyspora alba]|uniref:Nucleoside-diphosphate-sugar epimerase n=1 Tax=Haloactinopolyspora alba TaxID=648780 RepID=A0A2P8DZ08_9ACTN|nr:NAD(P)-dependent oxidoreductase [Haloactinopolyspora alba]PSL02453.1 nucleoside-diphosphate-sugar epimerase [Haloactinopolyspora alba]